MHKCEAIACDELSTKRYRTTVRLPYDTLDVEQPINLCEKHAVIYSLYCDNRGIEMIVDKEGQ